MLFTATPGDCAPLYGAICFAFGDQEAPRDLELKLYDARTEELIATKHLYQTNQGEVNIAPLLRRRMAWEAEGHKTGFRSARKRVQQIRLEVEDATAECCILPILPTTTLVDPLYTTLPTSRILVRGRSEELFLSAKVGRAELRLYTPWGQSHTIYRPPIGADSLLFTLNSQEWPAEVCRAELQLSNLMGEELVTLRYTPVEPTEESLRVAWVSSTGSIEHYTFPVVEQVVLLEQEEAAQLANGNMRRLSARYGWQQRVWSAYERPEMIRALSEIATSPQLWWVDGSEVYHPLSVKPEPLTLERHGLISTLKFTFRSTAQQLSLWS